MRKATTEENKKCPKCGKMENQVKIRYNHSGTRRCMCKDCGIRYTIDPKRHEYTEETKQLAMKIYYSGVNGRRAGKILGINKADLYNWIKKTETVKIKSEKNLEYLELDGLYWFVGEKISYRFLPDTADVLQENWKHSKRF